MSDIEKEHLSQIKSDNSKEMDADKYVKHSFFRYRYESTIPKMISPAIAGLDAP
jgi:hypothetical protein